jgi:cbb3-type cytochrome oxidase maturation protein
MEVILLLIAASLALAVLFLGVFVWATRSGQFDDTTTPPLRILMEDTPPEAFKAPNSKHS